LWRFFASHCFPKLRKNFSLLLIPNAFGTGLLLVSCAKHLNFLPRIILFFSFLQRKEKNQKKAPPFASSLREAKGQLCAVSQFAVQLHGAGIFPIVYQMIQLCAFSSSAFLLRAR
jgi:hypothetical protein